MFRTCASDETRRTSGDVTVATRARARAQRPFARAQFCVGTFDYLPRFAMRPFSLRRFRAGELGSVGVLPGLTLMDYNSLFSS